MVRAKVKGVRVTVSVSWYHHTLHPNVSGRHPSHRTGLVVEIVEFACTQSGIYFHSLSCWPCYEPKPEY